MKTGYKDAFMIDQKTIVTIGNLNLESAMIQMTPASPIGIGKQLTVCYKPESTDQFFGSFSYSLHVSDTTPTGICLVYCAKICYYIWKVHRVEVVRFTADFL